MRQFEIYDECNCVVFTSEKCRSWIPAKTIFVFAPDEYACSESRLTKFAEDSGWLKAAEEDGAVLAFPVARNGWQNESVDLITTLYPKVWHASQPWEPGNEMGTVWCWETLIFAVGYREGAVYAGNTAVAHPNYFAQVVLAGGQPDDYAAGERLSDHWLVPDAEDYYRLNRQVPVSVRFVGEMDVSTAKSYFLSCNEGSEADITVTGGDAAPVPALTKEIMRGFSTRIRWKNGPDGTPARCLSREEFYTSGEYIRDSVEVNGISYDFFTRFPKGREGQKNMPVVLSVHGHGEPAWLFSTKNGWDRLSDETGAFVLVLPDSPRNEWRADRDGELFGLMIDRLAERFSIDRSRVYLTGFSNGAMATSWFGTKYPELFAAISPWNSPTLGWCQELERNGWELPMFAINGDKDRKIAFLRGFYDTIFSSFIRANGGIPRLAEVKKPMTYKVDGVWTSDNVYTPERGYTEGDRMTTYLWNDLDGNPRVAFTELKNMPHGAIRDEARASWEFLKRFSRPQGSKKIVDDTQVSRSPYERTVGFGSGGRAVVLVPPSANAYTPSRSIILLPRSEDAADEMSVSTFLRRSGWGRRAVRDGSVLIVPLCPNGWSAFDGDLVTDLYQAVWSKTMSGEYRDFRRSPFDKVPGTDPANVWTWETLWNLVGYGDGARLAARGAIAHPNRFASVTLLGGATEDLTGGDLPSDHIHVSEHGKNPAFVIGVSEDYHVRNRDNPTALWIVTEDPNAPEVRVTADHIRGSDGIDPGAEPQTLIFAGLPTLKWTCSKNPAQRVLVSTGDPDSLTPDTLMDVWIGESIRWKNSPDGTLGTFYWQEQVESGRSPYIRETYRVPGETRDRVYYVYKPHGIEPKAPVVLTVHGHGEPAWMFMSKNGWPELADREKILIVSPADNDENRWSDEADSDSFVDLVKDICWKYSVDSGRIYISGFSNGNMQCFNATTKHPELFAAMWPMSSPATGDEQINRFAASSLELPLFATIGDNDGWNHLGPDVPDSQVSRVIAAWLKASGREPEPAGEPAPFFWRPDEYRDETWYRDRYGFANADRFRTWSWNNAQGRERLAITVMKNMPHGTVVEESQVAWDFLKRFSRLPDGTIVETEEA